MKRFLTTNLKSLHSRLEVFILILLIALGLFLRFYHFETRFNFSSEQAAFLSKSIELFNNKKLELIGPPISLKKDGREIYQGSITYYVQIPFLLMGKFDPVVSSKILAIFATLMVIPLYLGIKKSSNQTLGFFVSSVYLFFPPFIEHTRFFWNPNLQFIFSPVLIFYLFSKSKLSRLRSLVIGFISGLLLLFHYQFVVVLALLFIYFLCKHYSAKSIFIFIAGLILGFSPLAIFEFKHQFYNLRTILFVLQSSERQVNFSLNQTHYFLSIGLVSLALFTPLLKNVQTKYINLLSVFIFLYGLIYTLNYPNHAYGMSINWDYTKELRVYEATKIYFNSKTNIVNQIYDTQAQVQKYLAKINHLSLAENYTANTRLVVITDRNPESDNAYEFKNFIPKKTIAEFTIDPTHRVYIYEKVSPLDQRKSSHP